MTKREIGASRARRSSEPNVDTEWVNAVAAAQAAGPLSQEQADRLSVALVPWLSSFRLRLAEYEAEREKAKDQ